MTPKRARFVELFPVALAVGCGSSGGNGYSLDVGADDGGPSLVLGADDASATGAFDAHIEQNHIAVTFVTLSCAGPCADVVAVPTGGQAPYTFKWDDGSTTATRHVCPTSSTSYNVKVTDTGTTGELARPAETVQVPLAANVIACPDGGAADAGAPGDGSVTGCMTLTNPFVSGSSCPDEGGATYGTFTLPFPMDAGASYTMTLIPGLASTTAGSVTFYGLTATCGVDTLATITVPANSTMPQSACLHPHETLSSIALDFIGWTNTMTFCAGCAAP